MLIVKDKLLKREIHVLGIHLFNGCINDCIEIIKDICLTKNDKTNKCISATGAHGLVYAKKCDAFKNILENFFLNLPDGMPSVWLGRLKGARQMQRCYGPDFFKDTIVSTKDKSIKHFFCGGKEGVVKDLKRICEEKFGNKNIVGTFSPPFREMSDDEIRSLAKEINDLDANIVWIGLSTPKQEKFAYRLSKLTNVNFLCTVGAAFDFHTDKVRQAPKFLQRVGLEWFFRLIMEPKRLWKRYFEIVPKFIWYNLVELCSKLKI